MANTEANGSAPVRCAVLGFGLSARVFQLPFILNDARFELAAILDRSGTKVRAERPDLPSVSSFEEVLSLRPEVVVVSTPNSTHVDYARRALEAGCAVVLEKPMAPSWAEAKELCETARRRGVLLAVYQNRRWDGDFLTLKGLVERGELGRLAELESRFDRWTPGLRPKAWKEVDEPGNGLVDDLGTHLIDQIFTLFGPPLRVDARLRVLRDGSRVSDAFDARLEYPGTGGTSGLEVRVGASLLVAEARPRFAVYGSRGCWVKRGVDPQEAQLREGLSPADPRCGVEPASAAGLLRRLDGETWTETSVPTERGNYAAFYGALHASLRGGAPFPVKAEDAAAVIRCIELCRKSSAERRALDFAL